MDAETYARILDVKGIGKLPTFSGEQNEFHDWKFKFEVSMSLLQLREGMEAAIRIQGPIDFSDLSAEAQYKARVLFAILVQQVTGKALSIAKLVDSENGFEAWRRICSEYDPESNVRSSKMLVSILRPNFADDLEGFSKGLLDWEFSVKKWEMLSHYALPDFIKIAVIQGAAPKSIEPFLLYQEEFRVYQEMKEKILRYCHRNVKFDTSGDFVKPGENKNDPSAMNVDQLDKGKGKGKGKGFKGKSKDKGKGKGFKGSKGKDFKGGKGSGKSSGKFQSFANQKGKGSYQDSNQGYWHQSSSWDGYRHWGTQIRHPDHAKGKGNGKNSFMQVYDITAWDNDGSWYGPGGQTAMGPGAQQPSDPQAAAGSQNIKSSSASGNAQNQSSSSGVFVVGAVSAVETSEKEAVLIDSGSQINVCPLSAFPSIPLEPIQNEIHAVTASGKKLQHVGDKIITFRTENGFKVQSRFHVMNVEKTIFSAGRLSRAGHVLTFGQDSAFIQWEGKAHQKDHLIQKGSVYFLPAQVVLSSEGSEEIHRVSQIKVSSSDSPVEIYEINALNHGLLGDTIQRIQESGEKPKVAIFTSPDFISLDISSTTTVQAPQKRARLLKSIQLFLTLVSITMISAVMLVPTSCKIPSRLHRQVTQILPHSNLMDSCMYGHICANDKRIRVKNSVRMMTNQGLLSQATSLKKRCDGSHRHSVNGDSSEVPSQLIDNLKKEIRNTELPKVTKVEVDSIQSVCPLSQDDVAERLFGDGELDDLQEYAGDGQAFGLSDDEEVQKAQELEEDAQKAQELEQERVSLPVRVSKKPSQEEIAKHNLTHLPFASWCKHCIQRASDEPHLQRPKQELDPSESVEIQLDYSFMKTQKEGRQRKNLLIYVVPTQYGLSVLVPTKGPGAKGLLPMIKAFSLEAGLQNSFIRTRSDAEPSLMALIEKAVRELGLKFLPETGPSKSSQSTGGVSRYASIIAGQVRTLMSHLKEMHPSEEFTSDHKIFPYLVRHSSWVLNRYSVRRATGLTPFEATKRFPYKSKMLPFGVTAWMRIPGSTEPGQRIAPRWLHGVFLGRDSVSDEFIIVTEEGVFRSRTVRHVEGEDSSKLWTTLSWKERTNQRIVLTDPDEFQQAPSESPMPIADLPQQRVEVQKKDMQVGPDSEVRIQDSGTDPASQQVQDASTGTQVESRDVATEFDQVLRSDASTSMRPRTRDIAVPAQTKRTVEQDVTTKPTSDFSHLKRIRKSNCQEGGSSSSTSNPNKRRSETAAEELDPRVDPPTSTETQASSSTNALMIFLISVDGPPWFDSITGEQLDESQVSKGMEKELQSMKNMNVYQEVPESEADEVIKSRWVLSQKGPENVRCRIVAQQLANSVMDDTFASTSTPISLRLLLYFATVKKWEVCSGDVSTAFLHAELPKGCHVYVRPPVTETRKKPNVIWKLLKALYGLRHSPKWWQEHLRKLLMKFGWRPLVMDPSCYVRKDGLLVVHTDDLVMTGMQLEKWMKQIQQHLKVKWHGLFDSNWKKFLGKEYRRTADGFQVRVPEAYWEETVNVIGLGKAKVSSTPGEKSFATSVELLNAESHGLFRKAVGKLLWASAERPDLQFSIKELSRRCSSPTLRDWKLLERCLRYIKGTKTLCLSLSLDSGYEHDDKKITVELISDSDWAEDKSTSGHVLQIGGFTLQSSSKTQQQTSLSSCEAEFVSVSDGTQTAVYVQQLLEEINPECEVTIKVHTDSNSANSIANRRGPGRLKHLNRKFFWIQELTNLRVVRIPSAENIADMLTKYLPVKVLQHLVQKIKLVWP